jgi:hypothetical protein
VKEKPPNTVHVPFQVGDVFSWFDGASQINGTIVGSRGIIKTPDSSIIRWSYNYGSRTNSRA